MRLGRLGLISLGVLLAGAGGVRAQDAEGAPPESSPRGGLYVHELLPDIGVIGAQAGLTLGVCWNPYSAGSGACGGGYVTLPLRRLGSARLSYELDVSFSHGRSDPFTITDPIAYVANLAAGASPANALAGPPAAPFPVQRLVRTELRVLTVSPFGLRVAPGAGGLRRLRPYGAAGVDFVVVLSRQEPASRESAAVPGSEVFEGPLIGGLVAQSPELAAQGLPTGQGNLRLGVHGAVGVEVRASERMSVNAEYRYTAIEGSGSGTGALTAAIGFHW
jgi:opacity protein-like surface antigen